MNRAKESLKAGVKSLVLVGLMILLVLPMANCKTEADRSNDWVYNETFYGLLLSYLMQTKAEITIEDMGDGTLLYKKYSGHPDLSYGLKSAFYVKRCAQGQVYRVAEKDCKGTGSAEDNYGIQSFQYCSNNDLSCESETPVKNADKNDEFYLNGEGNSEVYKTCAGDTTSGRKWISAGVIETSATLHNGLSLIMDHWPYPSKFWIRPIQTLSETETDVIQYNTDKTEKRVHISKTESHYVICSSDATGEFQ